MREESFKAFRDTYPLYSAAIEQASAYADKEAYDKAVSLICAAGKTITCAAGHSSFAAGHFAHGLCCIDMPAAFLSPAVAIHGGSGIITENDVVMFISRGGKTSELMPILDISRGRGAKIIGVTENLDSPIAKLADVVLEMRVEREADKYNMMGTASFIITVAMLDALWMALLEETGYKKEQFGIIHPGGAVGARLNKKQI